MSHRTAGNRVIRAAAVGAMAATIGITTGAAASAATATPAKALRGAEHFSIVTTSSNIPVDESFIATGAFTAAGRDDAGPKMDRITLAGGGFTLHHSGRVRTSFDAGSCLLVENGSGAFTVGGGRGRYKGVTGTGKYVLSVRAVFPKNSKGRCSTTGDPIAIQYAVSANGHVVLP